MEAAVRGKDVRAEKSELYLAKEHNIYAKSIQIVWVLCRTD